MPLVQTAPVFSPLDYLEWEKTGELKHEYLDGEVFAMAGASDAHVTAALNIAAILRNHVRGGPCRTYVADMKVRVEAVNAFFYPDVMVSRDARDSGEYFKNHPILIVEVLSPSTAAFDRGRKFAAYRTLESLNEYLLVDTDAVSVELFRRDSEGRWVLYPYDAEGVVALDSVGLNIPVAAVYEDVVWEAGHA